MTANPEYIRRGLHHAFKDPILIEKRGRVVSVSGTIIKARGVEVKIGEICKLINPQDGTVFEAEVVGFQDETILLTPLGRIYGIGFSTEVIATGHPYLVPVGNELLGRVIDGLGNPLDTDTGGELQTINRVPIYNEPPNPMQRKLINLPLSMGVRAVDGLLTCCEGQRTGIFAGAGYGKSTLLGMLARNTDADVSVIGLIGERGREVREFIENTLGPEGLAKAVMVVSTSDRPSMERIKAAYTATAIAEYFRDQGKRVLLMLDSITRFARAQRELGLSAGEPPTRRGYPPSMFATLPLLLERAGQSNRGSITAVYTILVEGDDMNEPVSDEMRSLLDGHIVLSSKLVKSSHFPAIDVLASISRVMNQVVDEPHKNAAAKLRAMMAKYEEVELLVKIGEYKKGTDSEADEAIDKIDSIKDFLRQDYGLAVKIEETIEQLHSLTGI